MSYFLKGINKFMFNVFTRCDHYQYVIMFLLYFIMRMSIGHLKGFVVVVQTALAMPARGPVSWDLISLDPVIWPVGKWLSASSPLRWPLATACYHLMYLHAPKPKFILLWHSPHTIVLFFPPLVCERDAVGVTYKHGGHSGRVNMRKDTGVC